MKHCAVMIIVIIVFGFGTATFGSDISEVPQVAGAVEKNCTEDEKSPKDRSDFTPCIENPTYRMILSTTMTLQQVTDKLLEASKEKGWKNGRKEKGSTDIRYFFNDPTGPSKMWAIRKIGPDKQKQGNTVYHIYYWTMLAM